jgi:hypothetical protein
MRWVQSMKISEALRETSSEVHNTVALLLDSRSTIKCLSSTDLVGRYRVAKKEENLSLKKRSLITICTGLEELHSSHQVLRGLMNWLLQLRWLSRSLSV